MAYMALLPTIWSLLNQPSPNARQISSNVLRAMLEHATKTSSKSAVKKPTLEFVARLVLVSLSLVKFCLQRLSYLHLKLETERQYQGGLRVGRNSEETEKFGEWVVHLPKVLWELGSSNLSTTEVILRFLLRLFQRKSCLVHEEVSPLHIHSFIYSLTDNLFLVVYRQL